MANTRVNVDPSKVIAAISASTRKYRKSAKVEVVYEAPYAVYVHEDMQARHPNGGQAKYLEGPARGLQKQLAGIVTTDLRNKKSLESSLVRAAYVLLAASQTLVPVDTGALKASGKVVIA